MPSPDDPIAEEIFARPLPEALLRTAYAEDDDVLGRSRSADTGDSPCERLEIDSHIRLKEPERQGAAIRSADEPPPHDAGTERYDLEEVVARGGAGQVLRGYDRDLGREVALKRLRVLHLERPSMVQRFLEEAQICAQLQHPGIVPVYDWGTESDLRPFFTMKYVRGETLAALLNERPDPQCDRGRFLSIFEQVVQAVAYAHARGVIHRDLKPSNIMVGAFGEVQVMDWGLAKVFGASAMFTETEGECADSQQPRINTLRSGHPDADTLGGSIIGTPAYMSPEQHRGQVESLDERSDVFNLGAILCEILTGSPPFAGSGEEDSKDDALRLAIESAQRHLDMSGADEDLISIAKGCLAHEPKGRPYSAVALAERFTTYLAARDERMRCAEIAAAEERVRAEEAEVHARDAQRLAAQERRSKRLSMTLALAVIAALLIGGAAYFWIRGERDARAMETSRAVNEAMADARELRVRAQSGEAQDIPGLVAALTAAQRAESLAASASGSDELHVKACELVASLVQEEQQSRRMQEQSEADRAMLERLEEIKLRSFDHMPEKTYASYDWANEDGEYALAFREFGLDLDRLEPAEAARRIGVSAISLELLLALKSWAMVRSHCKGKNAGKLAAVLELASPEIWRHLLTGAVDLAKLRELAADSNLQSKPPRLSVELGVALANSGNEELGVKIMRKAQDLNPEEHAVHLGLGYLQMKRSTPQGLQEAARCYQAALALRPESPLAWHHLARVLIELGEKERPIAYLHRLVQLKPKLAWARYELGGGYRDTGDLAGAIRYYREATELDPFFEKAWFNLSAVLVDHGSLEEAIHASRKVTELTPDWALAWANLGGIIARGSDLHLSEIASRKAIQIDPSLALAHTNLGVVLQRKGDLAAAIEEYRKSIRIEPHDIDVREKLFRALEANADLYEAIDVCRQGINLQPESMQLHYALGYLLLQAGEFPEAIEEFERVEKDHPNNGSLLLNLAISLKMVGKFNEAIEALEKLRDLSIRQEGQDISIEEWIEDFKRSAKLKGELNRYLSGEREMTGIQDMLTLAQICRYEGHHDAAARYYREAVNRAKDELTWDQRYGAACTAAKKASLMNDEEEREGHWNSSEWRGWVRSLLEREIARKDADSEKTQRNLRTFLLKAQRDPIFSQVRDESSLEYLPELERELWRSLWSRIRLQLKRTNRK